MKISQLTETEVAYIAGLIDGEGSITMGKTASPSGDRKLRYRVHLTVAATTSMELVSWLVSKLGGCDYKVGRPKKKQHRQGYCMKLAEGPAEELLQRSLPYLVIKKRHAELFLRYREIQAASGPAIRWRKKDLKALRVVRDWFFQEFRTINAKGPKTVEANMPDTISEQEVVKIESELRGNLKRVSGDTAPPALIQ